MSGGGRAAVFLDRDGVVVEERGLADLGKELRLLPGAAPALSRLAGAGFALVVVTNQAVVARGLASEAVVAAEHAALAERLATAGALLDGVYVCPHHPDADDARYRTACDCRKPRPGLLLRAAGELELDLARSVMVGDRITDVAAGTAAGCATVLVRSGAHLEPTIELVEPLPAGLAADVECDDLAAAADWILGRA